MKLGLPVPAPVKKKKKNARNIPNKRNTKCFEYDPHCLDVLPDFLFLFLQGMLAVAYNTVPPKKQKIDRTN